ncbi:sulfotransferase [Synechococcus sp. UW140]|uniref:sulfotransferase n=1 Tax=Synechococcus sp. UW140 TaxID=368503 RepID=UPI000E0FD7E7|nr:sulfotransferase [Synechococcus sp. UW140]
MTGNGKTFILGVGAQKCGTSWLHHQLQQHPLVDMGFCKEYRALRDRRWREQLQQQLQHRSLDRPSASEQFGHLDDAAKHRLILHNERAYYRYFQWLMNHHPQIKATGDMSPHYSNLSRQTFKRAKRHLNKQGFTVKVIFLMRDPVERVWSQVRMLRTNGKMASVNQCSSEEEALALHYRHPRFSTKGQYHLTLQALRSAFPADALHCGFYESLFEQASLIKLSTFLDLDLHSAKTNERINASPKTKLISEALQAEIASHYRDVYTGCLRHFGEEILERWPSSRFIFNT